jgi:hypothetical protein
MNKTARWQSTGCSKRFEGSKPHDLLKSLLRRCWVACALQFAEHSLAVKTKRFVVAEHWLFKAV